MSNPVLPGSSPGRHSAGRGAEIPVPAMPVIQEKEKYHSGAPFLLLHGQVRTIGWQRQPAAGNGVMFVIVGRGRMGADKILESFPQTEEGWAAAWRSLVAADAAMADKLLPVLAAREGGTALPGYLAAGRDTVPVLIVTTNEIPGYRITQVHGDVFGLVVRARNYFSNLGASFRTLAGGEVAGYTKLLTDSRNQARERMWREARARGANAIVAMRFDCNEIGDIMSEVAAYGTAVTAEPLRDTAASPSEG
jgi:uncharacterized protein YbjQ (UPF0145 family)